MILSYEKININGLEYHVTIAPIMKCETKVMFSKPNFFIYTIIRIEDDEVVMNSGLSDNEIEYIKTWIDEHRLELWNKAQNTPLPTQEQLQEIAQNAVKELNELAEEDPIAANMMKNRLMGALENELERRQNDSDTSFPF